MKDKDKDQNKFDPNVKESSTQKSKPIRKKSNGHPPRQPK